jgi:DNA invertase Pin-like site-specific DNA recombinase
MIIGYARTSTADQQAGLEAQERDLLAAGCEKLFSEKTSSKGPRPKLQAAMEFLREGDTLIVTRPDRFARSTEDLLRMVREIEDKGANLRILSMNLNLKDATSKLMLTVMAAVAEFEREIMLERQREGIAKAKRDGRMGRPTALTPDTVAAVWGALQQGLSERDAAAASGASRGTVQRVKRLDPAKREALLAKAARAAA